MKRIAFILAVAVVGFSSQAYARDFTCNASIALTGAVNKIYTPTPWKSSCTPMTCDREKTCMNDIKAKWLNNGAIWGLLGLDAAAQNTVCQAGTGTFRVDYGFDERKKDWNFTQAVAKTGCKCLSTCPAGSVPNAPGSAANSTTDGKCKKLACQPLAAPPANGTAVGTWGFTWGNAVYQWVAASGKVCTF